MEIIEILQQVFKLENLQSFSKLNEAIFATFSLKDADYQQLLLNNEQAYSIIRNSTIIVVLNNGNEVKLKTPCIERCIGVSQYSQKPRVLLYYNPNDLLDTVKAVRFIPKQ